MYFVLLAMMVQPQLQASAEPPQRVARAERSRLDLRALDAALAPEARRERRGRQNPRRIQTWRGVPAIIVDGQLHGIW